jgi:hypothetical protein
LFNALDVTIDEGACDNGFASMLADLLRQNLEAKPKKRADFAAMAGAIAIVADDADVALTLRFERGGRVVIHDGIVGVPDVTVRGPSEVIMALSNLPSRTPLGLPIPRKGDDEGARAVRAVLGAVRGGTLHVYGAAFHPRLFARLSRVLSIA